MLKRTIKKINFLTILLLVVGGFIFFSFGQEKQSQALSTEQTNSFYDSFDEINAYEMGTTTLYGNSVITISNATDLSFVAYQVNNGLDNYANSNFYLTADIDLSGSIWTPIGTSTNPFKGIFYGEGHKISNISINEYSCDNSTTESGAGLFGNLSGAKICDLTLDGGYQNYADSIRAKGTLAGKISNETYIINCYDKTTTAVDQDGNSISSVGSATATDYIFKGGDVNGATVSYTTKNAIDKTITDASATATVGYVLYYNAKDGDFMVCDNTWYNSKLVKVLLKYNVTFSEYGKNIANIYSGNLPVHRQTAVNNKLTASKNSVYWFKEGYKASFINLQSLNFSKGLCEAVTYSQSTISVYLNHGYGTRGTQNNKISYTFKYDQSFASYFNENSYVKNRAGYEFEGLYASGETTRLNTETLFSVSATTENSFINCFPFHQGNYDFKWTAKNNVKINVKFAIANDEGGKFGTSALPLANAINNFQISWNDENYESINANPNNNSGNQRIIINLNTGYRIKTTTEPTTVGEDIIAEENTNPYYNISNYPSGAYAKFINHSRTGSSYEYNNNINNDDYSPVSTLVTDKGQNKYQIDINNVCGAGGEIWIVIEREWVEIEMEVQTDSRFTINYNWTLLTSTVTKWGNTPVTVGNSTNTLFVRRGEKVEIKLSVATENMYVLNSELSSIYLEPTANCETISYNQGITSYYRTFAFYPIEDQNSNKIEYSDGKIKFNLGPLETKVSVDLYHEDGSDFAKTPAIGVYINDPNMLKDAIFETSGAIVPIISNSLIYVTSNGYYEADRIEILKTGETTPFSQDFETVVNNINLRTVSAGATLIEPYVNGTEGVNYSIKIYFKERKYNVDYQFYFGGNNVGKKIGTNSDSIGNVISEITKTIASVSPSSVVNGKFTLTDVGLGSLYLTDIKISNMVGANKVSSTADGFTLSTPGEIDVSTLNPTNGTYNVNFTLGTYNTIVEIYLDYKIVNLKVNSLYNGTKVVNFSDIVVSSENHGNELNTLLKFDYSNEKGLKLNNVELSGRNYVTKDLASITLHTQYYLLGWYIQNGKFTNVGNYSAFLSDTNFVNNIAKEGGKTSDTTFDYSGVSPYVGYRKVTLSYAPGNKGYGELYSADATNLARTDDRVSAGVVTYNQKLNLNDKTFYNLGYTFSHYSASYGSFNNLEYSISGGSGANSWSSLFDNSSSVYKSWNSTVTENDTLSKKELTLTANWTITKYNVLIDDWTKTELSIGEYIYYQTTAEDKNGQSTYYFDNDNNKSNGVTRDATGRYLNGYVVTGYKIEHNTNLDPIENYGAYSSVYQLTPVNFKKFIAREFRFTINSDSNPIKITTLRNPAQYLLYLDTNLATKDNEYFSYEWFEDKDNADLGQIDSDTGIITINVTFDAVPENLTLAINRKALVVTRKGYSLSGWAYSNNGIQSSVFNTTALYNSKADDSHIVPIWKLKDESYSSIIEFDENVNTASTPAFYLEKSKDVLYGSYNGGDVTNLSAFTDNGEQVVDYYFEVYYNGTLKDTISKETVYNYDLYKDAGEYQVYFKVKLKDTLNRPGVATAESYTISSSVAKYKLEKNTLYFYDYSLHSIYNGTNEFIPNTIAQAGYDNAFGSFLYKFDWDGSLLSDYNVKEKIGDSDTWFENFVVVDNDPALKYNAGSGKTLQMTLKNIEGYFGNRELDKIFSNVTKQVDGSYTTQILGELTVDKARFTISFPEGSAYYLNGVQTLVYDNDTNYTFTYGQVTFEYTYDKIMLHPNALPGKYQGSGNHNEDAQNFTFVEDSAFVIKNHVNDRDTNFEWVISADSVFTLLDSSAALIYDYSAKYISANNGILNQTLADSFDGITETISIANLYVDGEKIEIPDIEQYSVFANNKIILSIAGINTNKIYTYINKSILNEFTLSFDIVINISSTRDDTLKTLIWTKSSSSISTIENGFNTLADYKTNVTPAFSDTNSSFYGVLTDTVKVNIDYNTGKNTAGSSTEVVYISSKSSLEIANPTKEYSGLQFDGYLQDSSSNITLQDKSSSKVFKTTTGGKSELFRAKWKFVSIDASLVKPKHEYYASKDALNLNISSIADITLPDSVTNFEYSLICGEESYLYSAVSTSFNIADERGFLVPSMSGTYTLSLVVVYSDGIQNPQTQRLDLSFEIKININVIEFVYSAGNLTFSNKAQESSITFAYNFNNQKQSDVKLSQLAKVDNTLSQYNSYVTIKNSANESAEMFNADTYTITFAINSDLTDIYKIADGKNVLQIIIEKYTIVLTDYSDEITEQLYKVFGQSEPNPIKAEVVIESNLNDEIEISFTRENKSDAINEEGYPVVCTGVIGEDSTNYDIDDSGANFTFRIVAPTQNLQVELESSFAYIYNGSALSNFVITYDAENDKYVLTGSAGIDKYQVTFTIYYVVGENKIEIPEEQKEAYTQEIIFSSSAEADVGEYNFTVSLVQGSTWEGVDIVNPALASITVTQREITVTKVEKVFDRTKNIISSGVNFDNLVAGDLIFLSGFYSSELVGTNISLDNLSLTGSKAGNYILKNPDFKGIITPAPIDEITFDLNKKTFNYGLLKENTALGDFFALSEGYTFANGEENDIRNGYIQISSFKVADNNLSTAGYINAGDIEVKFILVSNNFSGLDANGYGVTIKINPYSLDLSALQIRKEYNENALLPQNLNTSLEGYILTGDEVSIDLTKGGYDDKEIGENKHITIILTGNDSENYTVIDNITGAIIAYQITLNVVADMEHIDLVTDGQFVADGLNPIVNERVFNLEYPSYNPAQSIESLTLPTRKGYNAVGWKYYNQTTDSYILITEENLNDIFKEITEDEISENVLTIYTVWEIQIYTIDVQSTNIENLELTATDNKIKYLSSFEMNVTAVRGYKIQNVRIAQGQLTSSTLSDIGKRSGKFTFNKVTSDIKIVITTQAIKVTFEAKTNIPEYTTRTDSNKVAKVFDYTVLNLLAEEDLPQINVTSGTYNFSGYTYGSNSSLIGEKNLQTVVDELYPDDSLVTDVKIIINATWVGENYVIKFNSNGGTLEGASQINAVYGSAISDTFPTAILPGRSFTWKYEDITYNEGDILRSIGELVDNVWTITFTAVWTNNPYTLTVKFDEKLSIFINNVPISSGSEFEVVYSENQIPLLVRPANGYVYEFDANSLNGEYTENGNIITVYNLVEDGEIIFSSLPDDNILTINADDNVSSIKGYLVTAEGDVEIEITDNKLIAKTESTIKIVFTAKKGWIFSEKSISFAGDGTLTQELSQDKKTFETIWSEFVDNATIIIKAEADDNEVITGDLTDIFESLSFNGQAIDLTGDKYIIKTATILNITGVIKYGYMDGGVSSGENNYVREESVQNVFSATDRHYHFSAVIENFDEGFTLAFTNAPRIFNFSLSINEGQENYGEITTDVTQAVKFGEELTLTQKELLPTFMFDKWLYHNGKILNDIPNQTMLINETRKDIIECVGEGETINIIATYKRKVVSMTFSASGKGSYTISQTVDNVFYLIENVYPVKADIYMGQNLDFVISPVDGYEIDKMLFDEIEVNPVDYGYNVANGEMQVYIDLDNPIKSISISFKASVARVYVQAGTRVNYTDYLGTTAGGFIYLTDSQGNRLGDELYLEGKKGSVLIGGDYSISTYTDETLCFIVEKRSGFTQTVSASVGVIINEYVSGDLTVYSFENVRNLSEITVLFTAKENVVNVKFAIDGENDLAHAGIIEADTSSDYVSAIPYRGDNIAISVITGSDLNLTINSSLAYNLVTDENGKIKYSILYNDENSFEDGQISVGEVFDREALQTGYTSSADFSISEVNKNATTIFYVTPREYSIKFNVYDVTSVTMQEKVYYGEEWSSDLLLDEEKAIVFASRPGYTFLGYYTMPNGQGTQYINKDGKVVSRWLEDGYFYNGSSYELEGNFDDETNTYTLYANWLYNRASVTVEFVPSEVGNIEKSYNISDIITNLNSLSAWISQDNRWYAEIIIGANLQFKALEFDDYVFDSWVVAYEGGEGITKPANFNLENIQTGTYIIKAYYRPKYEINVLNENNGLSDGGKAWVIQDGQELTSGSFDSQKSVTLKAVPNEGYKFLYFVDNNTAQKIYATIDGNGIGSYTYSNLLTKAISITAVFTGKTISVNLDTKEIQTYHEIVDVRINGKVVDYNNVISAKVGDTITIEIIKKQGYSFDVAGANFTNSVNSSGNYVFSYTFSLDGLVASGDGYKIDIKFSAPREKINYKFEILLEDAYNETEEGKSGRLLLLNNNGTKINVDINSFYTYLYGEQFMLDITANENYQLKYVYLSTTDMIYNISDRVVDNVLVIDAILMDIYFDYEIKITACFERLLWTDVRADRFEGKGDKDNPYIISSAKEFALLSYLVNNGIENSDEILYSECYYVVTKNIDFKGRYFEPIGTKENPFNGTIDLGAYEFTNVSHYRDYTNPNPSYSGLFWHLGKNAKIKAEKTSFIVLIIVIVAVVLVIGIIIFLIFFFRKRKKKQLNQLANQ